MGGESAGPPPTVIGEDLLALDWTRDRPAEGVHAGPRRAGTPRNGGPAVFRLHGSPLPFFFFNDTATTEIYTLSLHDALPIFGADTDENAQHDGMDRVVAEHRRRSEEHTSELQSRRDLVCRLLLEKKKEP